MQKKRQRKYPNDEPFICGTWLITGDAARLVKEKIASVKEKGKKVYGTEPAIQSLLCEYYKARQQQLGKL